MDVDKELSKLKEDCKAFFGDIYKFQDTLIVFGQGNPKSSLVLVGEAPGRQEVVQQTPFVGKAGGNLNEFLHILGKKREDIYITNVVKFRPIKTKEKAGAAESVSNRAPNREEIELSRGWLYREINIIKPDVVVSLGNIALKTLARDESLNIGQTHGQPVALKEGIFDKELALFPLYHPASVIYRRNLRDIYIKDIKNLKEFLDSRNKK